MSDENLELARRTIDALNGRDLEAYLELMDENVESVSRIVSVEGPLWGHEGVRRWWESWFAAFPDYETEIVESEAVGDGDVVIAALRAVGHGAGSSVPFEDSVWNASEWHRGKCVWWQNFETRTEAVEAALAR